MMNVVLNLKVEKVQKLRLVYCVDRNDVECITLYAKKKTEYLVFHAASLFQKMEPLDVSQLYCKCCDLSFTSEQHAQQHYMGRNHQRVLHGLKPLKAGYYNKDTGKWQRM